MERRYKIDLALRFLLAVTFALTAGICFRGFFLDMQRLNWTYSYSQGFFKAFSGLAIGLYSFMIAVLYVLRLKPISTASGAMPIAAAILGGFLMSVILLLSPRDDLPLETQILACVLVFIGNIFAVAILTRLGRSFSILPESRRLVTEGPYKVVRHPLYLAEAVSTLGVVIHYLSPWAILLIIAQLTMQVVRIHYEEKVLCETFPEYAEYAKRTYRLIPGIY